MIASAQSSGPAGRLKNSTPVGRKLPRQLRADPRGCPRDQRDAIAHHRAQSFTDPGCVETGAGQPFAARPRRARPAALGFAASYRAFRSRVRRPSSLQQYFPFFPQIILRDRSRTLPGKPVRVKPPKTEIRLPGESPIFRAPPACALPRPLRSSRATALYIA